MEYYKYRMIFHTDSEKYVIMYVIATTAQDARNAVMREHPDAYNVEIDEKYYIMR